MTRRKCTGYNVATGEHVSVEFDSVIQHVDPVLDSAEDTFLSPGFVDLQVNGFAGVDYNSPAAPHEEIARSMRVMFSTGVTRFFPTVITGAPEKMLGALRNLAAAREALEDGAAMEAFHVEGPHISSEDGPRGAHPAHWVRPPDVDEFHRWQDAARGNVRLVTLSPEWPGAPRYIETLARDGVATSIGHTARHWRTDSRRGQRGCDAFDASRQCARTPTLPRWNYIWDQLAEDRLAASFIVDGIHLPDSFCANRTAREGHRAQRPDHRRSDACHVRARPLCFGRSRCRAERGRPRGAARAARDWRDRACGWIARSKTSMRIAGVSLMEAITMATINPARIGRVVARQRGVRNGERADLVRFRVNGGIEVVETYLDGRRVFAGT